MKTKPILKLLLGLVLAGIPSVAGAISVGASGSGTISFNSLPPVTDWSTVNVQGGHNTTRTDAQWDATMATNSAASINNPLGSQGAAGSTPLGYWRSDLLRIVTQPTGGGSSAVLLMATLRNTSGDTISTLNVAYVMSDTIAPTIEGRKGHRVYYSLNGTSWTAVGNFNITDATSTNVAFSMTSLAWATNALMYVVWLDEDGVSPDGDYGIDDISFTPPISVPTSIAINNPTNTQNFAVGVSITVDANVTGSVTNVSFFADGGFIGRDTNSPFGLVYSNSVVGPHTLTAVVTDTTGVSVTSAVVTITNVLVIPTVLVTAPTNTQNFLAGTNITISATATAGVVTNVAFYVDGALIGNDTSNPYSVVYSNSPVGGHALTAVVRDNLGQSVTSAVVNITVVPLPPTVVITTPINSQNFPAGSSVTVSANATGSVTNVGFYSDGVLIGNDTNSPFSLVYSNASTGGHALTAVVRDIYGQSVTSAVVNITVVLVPPTVVITSPANAQSFLQELDITINATVTGGVLTNVSFYRDGGVLIGNDPSSPFGLIYSGATVGAHTLTAVVRDNLGQSATSAVINITVSSRPGISVGISGAGPFGFAALPTVQDGWSTTNLPGGPGDVATTAQFDAEIQTNVLVAAANITGALPTDAVLPVSANGLFRWNSAGSFIESRANSTKLNLLMAMLRNNVGADVGSFNVSYDFGELAGIQTESVPGFRVYYSLSGAANSWQLVPALSTGTTGALTATIPVGNWPAGTAMYLLWGDDNASGTEGSYTIDNFAITTVVTNVPTPVTITNQPPNLVREVGQSAVFTVGVNGSSPYYYEWYYGTNPIGGANGPTYTIPGVSAGNAGQYHVVVSNAFSSATSTNALLTVTNYPVVITNQPLGAGVAIGGSATFNVGVSGTPPFFYQWYFGASPIGNATNSSYTVNNAQPANGGIYTVQVNNLNNTVTSSNANLVVIPDPYTLMAYSNVWKYNQSNVNLGTAWKEVAYDDSGWSSGPGILAVENCNCLPDTIRTPLLLTFPGSAAQTPTYYFRSQVVLTSPPSLLNFAVTNLIDDGAVFYVNGVEVYRFGMPAGAIAHTTLAAASVNDAVALGTTFPSALWIPGTNILAVEVHQNALTSADITFGMKIIVTELFPTSLSITSQPVSLTVGEAMPATFQVGVSGTAPSYRWFKDGTPIVGATSGTYTIPVTTTSNSGTYFVLVSNSVNFVFSSNATLLVTNYPVVITSQPASGTNTAGTPVNLSVSASGSTPRFFTWYKDAAPVAGATNQTFSIPNATTGDSGNYFVIVSNLNSSATSSVAALTVVVTSPTVTITTPVDGQIFPAGGGVQIDAAVTGGLLTNVTFYRDGGVLIGNDASSPFLALYTGATLGAHTLTAVVQDNLGQSATSAVVNITVQTGPFTFGTLPKVLEGWATTNLGAVNWTYTNVADIDAAVQTIVATNVITPLIAIGQVVLAGTFQWNSNVSNIVTYPTLVGATFLVATFWNNTGSNASSVYVSYDFGELFQHWQEEVPGLRVYYSLTGASNSWQLIPSLTTETTGALSATLSVTNWAAGDALYLLWADDNNGNFTTLDVAYTIDNFAISVGVPAAPALQITHSAGGALTLNWPGTGYTLQQSAELLGTNTPWADVPGPVTTSPYTTNNPAGSRFFRLRP